MLTKHETGDHRKPHSAGARGFTLVELLVVVVILGILVAVVVFSLTGVSTDAQDNACASEERTIETALETYYAENRGWPGVLADLESVGLIRSLNFTGNYAYDNTNGDLSLINCPT